MTQTNSQDGFSYAAADDVYALILFHKYYIQTVALSHIQAGCVWTKMFAICNVFHILYM